MTVQLVWVTPNAEELIMKMARVSSTAPDSKDTRLLGYLINHKHWSPFEMCNMCVEIDTTRDISSQLLRHKSFNFQEFSQRYAEISSVAMPSPRKQDTKNRQNSTDNLSKEVSDWWCERFKVLSHLVSSFYDESLKRGIAKECARAIMPMASKTKLYVNGNLRSWIHYFDLRCHKSTQLEHREIAKEIRRIFNIQFPILAEVLDNKGVK